MERDYSVNWPGVLSLSAIVFMIFASGLLLGMVINDTVVLTTVKAFAWLSAGIVLGIIAVLNLLYYARKGRSNER
ncbi:hypothetical protein K5713_04235 [Trueperella pyogenes]|uniref:hypothetical protein n=1 Tax=Trueperella pyogenes TaxID=1661 RepID=UPI002168B8D4|nr:hypothetical protein [Trueperella pyogenes]UVJ54497.1 hypothetical protein K5713_04235 [Trueperella pyogenes]